MEGVRGVGEVQVRGRAEPVRRPQPRGLAEPAEAGAPARSVYGGVCIRIASTNHQNLRAPIYMKHQNWRAPLYKTPEFKGAFI